MNFSDIEREFKRDFSYEVTAFQESTGEEYDPLDSILAFFKAKHDAYQQWLLEEIEKKKKEEGKHDGHINDEMIWCYDCNTPAPEEEFTQNWKYNQALSDIQELVKGNKTPS